MWTPIGRSIFYHLQDNRAELVVRDRVSAENGLVHSRNGYTHKKGVTVSKYRLKWNQASV